MTLKLKCIELYLELNNGAELDDIKSDLDLPYIELYPLLEVLETQERIRYEGDQYLVC